MKPKVLIFTKKVLPYSNTFVAVQAKNTPDFQPVYIGFGQTHCATDLIGDAKTCVQAKHESYPKLKKLLLECFSYISKGWLAAIKTHKPSLIHAHFGKGGYYCLPIAKQLKLPLMVTFHGSDITQKDKFSYSQKHRKQVFEQADVILAVSKFIEKKLLAKGCPEEKIIQLYTGIDTEFFTPVLQKSQQPSIMFLGRLIKQKGCHLLIDAMKTISDKLPKTSLVIVGDGVERAALEAQAKDLPNITFVGEQNSTEVKAYLDKAWVMCAPSIVRKRGNEEGLGSVFLEAQAMKTPVVSFNTGGVSEAVIANETGLVIDEISSDSLATALIKLLTDNDLRAQLADAGREHVVNNFNVITQGKKLAKIYQNTLKHNKFNTEENC